MSENVKGKIIQLPKQRQKECVVVFNDEDEPVAYYEQRKKRTLGANWVATFQSGLEWLSMQENMTGEQWRVFAFLMSKLDFDNYLRVPQRDICERLNMKKPNVSRAIKALIDFDVIIPGPMAGRYKTYRLNPRIGMRGTKHFHETVVEYDELKKMRDAKNAAEKNE